ncbi:MAG TPA: ABC transporter permease [Pilimelia sp.]|nr:ABC transporter permease [Pilimelia sp.]
MGRRVLTRPAAPLVLRRLGQALLTLAAGSILVWSLVALAPGDPAVRVLAANNVANPTAAQVEAKRAELGLTGDPITRYGRWAAGAARGDLGDSWVTGRPVAQELGSRLPATLRLTVAAVALSLAFAVGLAVLAVSAAGRWPDAAVRLLSTAVLVLPSFVVGLILLHVVVLRWGRFQVIADGTWGTVGLPALTLAAGTATAWSRVLRSGLLQARGAAYTEVARARGAGRWRLLAVHEMPNALLPFLTVVGTGTAALLGGAPIVETVFTWPGVGRFAVQAIGSRDLPVIQGCALLAIVAFILVSLLVDLVAVLLDPRVAEPTASPPHRRTRRTRRART